MKEKPRENIFEIERFLRRGTPLLKIFLLFLIVLLLGLTYRNPAIFLIGLIVFGVYLSYFIIWLKKNLP